MDSKKSRRPSSCATAAECRLRSIPSPGWPRALPEIPPSAAGLWSRLDRKAHWLLSSRARRSPFLRRRPASPPALRSPLYAAAWSARSRTSVLASVYRSSTSPISSLAMAVCADAGGGVRAAAGFACQLVETSAERGSFVQQRACGLHASKNAARCRGVQPSGLTAVTSERLAASNSSTRAVSPSIAAAKMARVGSASTIVWTRARSPARTASYSSFMRARESGGWLKHVLSLADFPGEVIDMRDSSAGAGYVVWNWSHAFCCQPSVPGISKSRRLWRKETVLHAGMPS